MGYDSFNKHNNLSQSNQYNSNDRQKSPSNYRLNSPKNGKYNSKNSNRTANFNDSDNKPEASYNLLEKMLNLEKNNVPDSN